MLCSINLKKREQHFDSQYLKCILLIIKCLSCMCIYFCWVFGSSWEHLETEDKDKETTVYVRTDTVLCVLPPCWERDRERSSFTPTESVTHHEACLSPLQYIWYGQISESDGHSELFCNIHFICMPDVLSIFHYMIHHRHRWDSGMYLW